MNSTYPTKTTKKLTGATDNQLKYWTRIGLVSPEIIGKTFNYSFRDIIALRLIIDLKQKGLSLQRLRKGLANLKRLLPDSNDPLHRLIIHTDGEDMIVVEKGTYFSAITKQHYFKFDTEQIEAEIFKLEDQNKYTVNTRAKNQM